MTDPKIRSLSYHLLSHMFYYPEKNDGILIGQNEHLSCLSHLSYCEDLQPWLNSLPETLHQTHLEALQVEYVRLFDYRPVCPPYESAYLRGRQKNQIVKNLKELYRQSGLQCREDEGHDHVIVELEFMHYLYAQESKNEKDVVWKNLRLTFLEDHLLKWTPLFCRALQEKAAEAYKQLGHILSAVMASEMRRQSPQNAGQERGS